MQQLDRVGARMRLVQLEGKQHRSGDPGHEVSHVHAGTGGHRVPDLRAKRNTVRSDMPMCMAMLQNQAKNVTCQKVNFVWPGSGSPPFQIDVLASCQTSPTDLISVPVAVEKLAGGHKSEGQEDQHHPGRGDVGELRDALVAVAATIEISGTDDQHGQHPAETVGIDVGQFRHGEIEPSRPPPWPRP